MDLSNRFSATPFSALQSSLPGSAQSQSQVGLGIVSTPQNPPTQPPTPLIGPCYIPLPRDWVVPPGYPPYAAVVPGGRPRFSQPVTSSVYLESPYNAPPSQQQPNFGYPCRNPQCQDCNSRQYARRLFVSSASPSDARNTIAFSYPPGVAPQQQQQQQYQQQYQAQPAPPPSDPVFYSSDSQIRAGLTAPVPVSAKPLRSPLISPDYSPSSLARSSAASNASLALYPPVSASAPGFASSPPRRQLTYNSAIPPPPTPNTYGNVPFSPSVTSPSFPSPNTPVASSCPLGQGHTTPTGRPRSLSNLLEDALAASQRPSPQNSTLQQQQSDSRKTIPSPHLPPAPRAQSRQAQPVARSNGSSPIRSAPLQKPETVVSEETVSSKKPVPAVIITTVAAAAAAGLGTPGLLLPPFTLPSLPLPLPALPLPLPKPPKPIKKSKTSTSTSTKSHRKRDKIDIEAACLTCNGLIGTVMIWASGKVRDQVKKEGYVARYMCVGCSSAVSGVVPSEVDGSAKEGDQQQRVSSLLNSGTTQQDLSASSKGSKKRKSRSWSLGDSKKNKRGVAVDRVPGEVESLPATCEHTRAYTHQLPVWVLVF
jgi:hypothetical protein